MKPDGAVRSLEFGVRSKVLNFFFAYETKPLKDSFPILTDKKHLKKEIGYEQNKREMEKDVVEDIHVSVISYQLLLFTDNCSLFSEKLVPPFCDFHEVFLQSHPLLFQLLFG